MDGDFAPMIELVKLRKKYGFLLVLDDVSSLEFSSICIVRSFDVFVLYAHSCCPGIEPDSPHVISINWTAKAL